MPTEKRIPKKTKAQQFVDGMIRCRCIGFAKLGMMVEVDGDLGTIAGMNGSADLDIQFANRLQYGKHAHNCHPTWNVKYFDATGKEIAHIDECKCLFRPIAEAA